MLLRFCGACARATSLAAGCLFLSCAPAHVPFEVSAPAAIPPGVLGKIDPDGTTTLYLDDLDLNIAMRDQRLHQVKTDWQFALVPFLLPIVFAPVRTTVAADSANRVPHVMVLNFRPREEEFSFDPQGVRVTFDEGNEYRAETFIGPVNESCTGGWIAVDASRDFALPAGETSCFVLQFPIESSPAMGFRLYLTGLLRDGETTQPLELRFARFSGNTEE
jgi:hypothetical protein